MGLRDTENYLLGEMHHAKALSVAANPILILTYKFRLSQDALAYLLCVGNLAVVAHKRSYFSFDGA